MPTVQHVLDALDVIAPAETAFSFDKVGLQVGDRDDPVDRGVVALDASPGLLEFAERTGAQIAVCHHPLIWEPLAAVNGSTRSGRMATEFIRRRIAFIGAHTNWDSAPGGINDALAERLGLVETRPFGSAAEVPYFKLTTFVPEDSASALLDAMAAAGAGRIGLYERCAFLGPGTGTIHGISGANPTVGEAGRIETVPELRVEMRVPARRLAEAVKALKVAHPYEEAAYDVYPLAPVSERPAGRIGRLSEATTLAEFAERIDRQLGTKSWAFGEPRRPVRTVAVCGGAADSEWAAALREGADAFVTGEIRHHIALEAVEAGFAVIAAGHYATEHPGAAKLATALAPLTLGIEWRVYEPANGNFGRPL